MTQPYNLAAIRDLLTTYFNNSELKDLCFRLGLDWDDIAGDTRPEKAQELVLRLQRTGRLPELQTLVQTLRPHAQWPGASVSTVREPTSPPAPTRWQLQRQDREQLIRLLIERPEFRSETRRDAFLEEMLAGSPRRTDILGQINLGGPPRQFAGHLLTVLTQFGQDEPGQEALGLLINHLLPYLGDGPDKEFLLGLFARYPLKTSPVATRALPPADWRSRESPQDVQEKIIGENTLRDIRLLELALDAARAVVRIVTPTSLGSGFLAGAGLIMTNHHVIPDQTAAKACAYQFNYQLDKALNPLPVNAARTKPDGLFYTNPQLDVTVVEALDVPDGVTPLALARLRAQKEERVNIIQHPGGHYKKISMQNNFVAYADARTIQYLTSTEPGSSGSPVFNNDFLVIGIHHSGGYLPEPNSDHTYLRNAGSSMIAILDDLQAKAPAIYARLRKQ